VLSWVVLVLILFVYSNIRPAVEKPMRDGEVCSKYRTEPFEKPELTDTVLKLAGVKPY
jgi:hypothetical protein